MKCCINCGQQIKAGAHFCTFCGATQQLDTALDHEQQPTAKKASFSFLQVIVVALVGIIGVAWYHNYQIEHLTQQEVADVGAKVAKKYLANQVAVYYSESNDLFTLQPKSDSTLEKTVEQVISGTKDSSAMDKYVTNLKAIAQDLERKIPKKDRDYSVVLLNPYNTDNYLYNIKDSKLVFNFVTDDDTADTSAAYAHMDEADETALRERIAKKYERTYGDEQ